MMAGNSYVLDQKIAISHHLNCSTVNPPCVVALLYITLSNSLPSAEGHIVRVKHVDVLLHAVSPCIKPHDRFYRLLQNSCIADRPFDCELCLAWTLGKRPLIRCWDCQFLLVIWSISFGDCHDGRFHATERFCARCRCFMGPGHTEPCHSARPCPAGSRAPRTHSLTWDLDLAWAFALATARASTATAATRRTKP